MVYLKHEIYSRDTPFWFGIHGINLIESFPAVDVFFRLVQVSAVGHGRQVMLDWLDIGV